MRGRAWWVAAGCVAGNLGCSAVLGDFDVQTGDATAPEASADSMASPEAGGADRAAPGADATADARVAEAGADATIGDAGRDGDAQPRDAAQDAAPDAPDGGCAAGLAACDGGCVALDASTSCGACGHDCRGGACTAGACGAYVVAQQPTTGTVAKLATDGTRVVWSDTGLASIEQVGARGGAAIALAPASSTNGAVGSELALAGTTVAFVYLGVAAPSLGLATADVADSGTSALAGAVALEAVSLNAAATHVFFVNVTGTQGSLEDCPVSGLAVGSCAGVGG
ncbi:MAG TPA: hypothetical protein VE987_14950, partial [Polyangiaceae bacterium]|nr:hypothetical protein [Polyangiaceae bacterium]